MKMLGINLVFLHGHWTVSLLWFFFSDWLKFFTVGLFLQHYNNILKLLSIYYSCFCTEILAFSQIIEYNAILLPDFYCNVCIYVADKFSVDDFYNKSQNEIGINKAGVILYVCLLIHQTTTHNNLFPISKYCLCSQSLYCLCLHAMELHCHCHCTVWILIIIVACLLCHLMGLVCCWG